jgi:hypothetical protein
MKELQNLLRELSALTRHLSDAEINNKLNDLSPEDISCVQKFAAALSSRSSHLQQKLLLKWKGEPLLFFDDKQNILNALSSTMISWDTRRAPIAQVIRHRLRFCNLFRWLGKRKFHTGKSWRRHRRRDLARHISSTLLPTKSEIELEASIKKIAHWGMVYDGLSKFYGGDEYLLVMRTDRECRQVLWRPMVNMLTH